MRRLSSGMSRLHALAVASSVVTWVLAGCSGDEVVAPVDGTGGSSSAGSTSTSSGSSSSSASQSSSSTGGGPVLRTILSRNPFGEQAGNLLADGDFDLSFGFPGQQGWTAYTTSQQVALVAETGGLCKSGLRCARVAPGVALFARGTSAADEQEMRATIWAKPTDGTACENVFAQAIGCDSFLPRGTLMRSALGDDDDGWCSFTATVSGSKVATCLYVENDSDQPLLLDAATLVAIEPSEAARPAPLPPPSLPPARRARMERVRDLVRDTLPFGSPRAEPPRPGQLAD